MSELLDKQVNAQKERLKKYFWGSCKLPQTHEKCAMKMKETNKEKHEHKNVIDGRKLFIIPIPKTNAGDLHELQVNDYGYNEGSYYLFSKRVNWCQEDGFLSVGARTGTQWLVLGIGDADFLHCWFVDSTWLECAESLITSYS